MNNLSTVKGPMPFTAENLQKSIDGTKTQTRRVIKPQPSELDWIKNGFIDGCHWCKSGWSYWGETTDRDGRVFPRTCHCTNVPGKIHKVGDILYLPEKHRLTPYEFYNNDKSKPPHIGAQYDNWDMADFYKSDIGDDVWNRINASKSLYKWRTSRFMFKFMARTFVLITGVKCERLQDIRSLGCIAEGISKWVDFVNGNMKSRERLRMDFARLWDSINGKTYPWASNPWVFAYTYKILRKGESW